MHKPPARYVGWYGFRMLTASRQIASQQTLGEFLNEAVMPENNLVSSQADVASHEPLTSGIAEVHEQSEHETSSAEQSGGVLV